MKTEAGPEFWASGKLGTHQRSERVLFGHVREDIDIEIHLASLLQKPRRAMVITSGGCTALALRPLFGESIYSLDINPAQNRLAELKFALIESLSSIEDWRRLHHSDARAALAPARNRLSDGAREFWDQNVELLRRGVHRCGAIDRKLGGLRLFFHLFVHGNRFVRRYLKLGKPEAQATAFDRQWNSLRWKCALSLAFNPHLLRTLLHAGGVDIPSDLPEIMKARFRTMLTGSPAVENRAAYELFLGKFPPRWNNATPHLRKTNWEAIRNSSTKVHFMDADAAEWLANVPPRSLDLISISNILEQSKPAYRCKLLAAAEAALATGGILVARSILPWPADFRAGGLYEIPAAELPAETSGICSLVRAFRKSRRNQKLT